MAKQELIFPTGKVGPVIYYKWKGILCVRAAPKRVKQTQATKRSAEHFGKAVRLSQTVRIAFQQVIGNCKDSAIKLRFNTALFHWFRQKKPLEQVSFVGFEFNPESELNLQLRKKLKCEVAENGTVRLIIPALTIPDDILFPKGTQLLQFNIAAVGCDLNYLSAVSGDQARIEIPFETGRVSSKTVNLRLELKRNTINIVGVGLRYFGKQQGELVELGVPDWRSAAIIDARLLR
jgi:hypothetical protein